MPEEVQRLLDYAEQHRDKENDLHVTTMRLPTRTIGIIDERRGKMNRTQFVIFIVDQIGNTALGAEIERCTEEKVTCERT